MSNPETPFHFQLATFLIHYTSGEEIKQRHANTVFSTSTGVITKDTLNEINASVIANFTEQSVIDLDQIESVVILSISSMGWMTEAEFAGQAPVGGAYEDDLELQE